MIKFIFGFLMLFAGLSSAEASTYNNTTNLFENSYSNQLIDMAVSQIDNFSNKSYAIFQSINDYYLIAADRKNVSLSGNRVNFTDSDIIRIIRNTSGSYNYTYSTIHENSTTLNISYILISNIDTNYSVSSSRFDDYYFRSNLVRLCMFILGIVFAIFLVKERSHI